MGNHRADVKTPRGVIEFQASSIGSTEVQEREEFYGKMIWVVKANTFDLEAQLSPAAKSFYYKFLDSRPEKSKLPWGCVSEEDKIKQEHWQAKANATWNEAWLQDPMYRWRWPRATWGFASKKIYLDLGDKLFGITWMSPDCKMIKGSPWDKEKFIAKLLA